MKKIALLLAVVLVAMMAVTGCSSKKTLKMATEAGFAPYEYYEDGKIVGVDVDIANEIAKEMGMELEIIDMELQIKDLETIESRLSRVQKQAQTGQDKNAKKNIRNIIAI